MANHGFLVEIAGAIAAYMPPGADPRGKEWSFVPDLAHLVMHRFAQHQVNYVMELLREVSLNGAYLNAPTVECRGALQNVDPLGALDQVIYGLMKIPSPQFIGEQWNINRPMHVPGRAAAAVARTNVSYQWGPPQAPRQFKTAQLFLEMRADMSDHVALTLRFQDQMGWLFDEAVNQVNTAAKAVASSLAEFGSSTAGLNFLGTLPVGQAAVNNLMSSGAPYVAR
jgi:hypothetical protein